MVKKIFYIIALNFTVTLISCNKIPKNAVDKSDEVIGREINVGLVTEMGNSVPFFADVFGQGAEQVANLYFEKINLEGGINGRVIKIFSRNASIGEAHKVKGYVEELLKEKDIFAFFWPYCLKQTQIVSETLKDTGIPVLFPLSGVNNMGENIFYIRPSFFDERDAYVQKQFRKDIYSLKTATVTEKQDICYYARDLFFANKELDKVNLASDNFYDSVTSIAPKVTDKISIFKTKRLIKKLKEEDAKILLLYSSPQGAYFIKLLKDTGYNPVIHAYSLFFAERILEILNPGIKNFYFSNPFPLPSEARDLKIVQELEMLMKTKGLNKKISSIMLEGFIGAKIFVQVLKNVGPQLTRRKFIQELKSLRNQDFGGINIDFSKDGHRGNSKVYIYKYDDRKFKLISE